MKKSCLFILILALLCFSVSFAESFDCRKLGFMLGIGTGKFSGDKSDFSEKKGAMEFDILTARYAMPMTNKFVFIPEIGVGFSDHFLEYSHLNANVKDSVEIWSIKATALFGVFFNSGLFINIGPSFRYAHVSEKLEILTHSFETNPSNANLFLIDLNLGLGVKFAPYEFSLRYIYGMRDVYRKPNLSEMKLMLYFTFWIKN